MAITYHKSVADTGGAIGDQIFSGSVDGLLPEISLLDQQNGVVISRKFYIKNDNASPVTIPLLSMEYFSVFSTILFESTGDAQVVGDLTGSEVDESPIYVVIAGSSHVSFWLQVTVPVLSTTTQDFNTVDVKQIIEG